MTKTRDAVLIITALILLAGSIPMAFGQRTTTSNELGYYMAPLLPPGA
jgi:hypothetical protein